jgi:integrase
VFRARPWKASGYTDRATGNDAVRLPVSPRDRKWFLVGPVYRLRARFTVPLTAAGIYQMIARRGQQCGLWVYPHRFRHHFSHTWLDRGGPEGDLMELNGWTSPQMLRRYAASARSARARRTYDRIMTDT